MINNVLKFGVFSQGIEQLYKFKLTKKNSIITQNMPIHFENIPCLEMLI